VLAFFVPVAFFVPFVLFVVDLERP